MPIEHFQASAILANDSGLNADASVNTWHFEVNTTFVDPEVAALDIANRLEDFYSALGPRMSSLLTQLDHQVKVYRMSDPEPRQPLVTHTFDIGTGPDSAPLEVALVLSFESDVASGEAPARHRGRIYWGPLAGVTVNVAGTNGRPHASVLDDLLAAALALATANTDFVRWATYSKVGNILAFVTHVWVDNEWDTQRRRGRTATARVEF